MNFFIFVKVLCFKKQFNVSNNLLIVTNKFLNVSIKLNCVNCHLYGKYLIFLVS